MSLLPYRVNDDIELRLMQEADAPAAFVVTDRNRDQLRQWLPWVDKTRSAVDILATVRAGLRQHAENNGFAAGIWRREEFAGAIGFHTIQWSSRNVSIGYWLAADHQGQGIMTAACSAMLDIAFGHYGLHRVEIRCAVENHRSCAIPRRLGFRHEGVLREAEWVNTRFVDLNVFSILEGEWPGRSAC